MFVVCSDGPFCCSRRSYDPARELPVACLKIEAKPFPFCVCSNQENGHFSGHRHHRASPPSTRIFSSVLVTDCTVHNETGNWFWVEKYQHHKHQNELPKGVRIRFARVTPPSRLPGGGPCQGLGYWGGAAHKKRVVHAVILSYSQAHGPHHSEQWNF